MKNFISNFFSRTNNQDFDEAETKKVISTQVASDVVRDGLGFELVAEDGEVIAEIFRSDKNKEVFLNTFGNNISLRDIVKYIELAKERLDTYEDGTPL